LYTMKSEALTVPFKNTGIKIDFKTGTTINRHLCSQQNLRVIRDITTKSDIRLVL
jgi:hypothetical protein